MPSPFPGMDPYLEGSEWTSVHTELAGEIARQLVPKVAPKYTVRPVHRFIMDASADIAITRHNTYPDVGLYHVQEVATPYHLPATFSELPLLLDTVMPEQIPITSEVWPITLAMPLPTIPVPLLPEDSDVPLDLQQSFTTAYDSYRYDLSIIYSQPPEIPLEGEWANWANELLAQAGPM